MAAPQASALWLALLLLSVGACSAAPGPAEVCGRRFVVRYLPGQRQQELARLSLQGFRVQTEGPGFFAVRKCTSEVAAAREAHIPHKERDARHRQLLGTLSEEDHPVLAMRPMPSAGRHASSAGRSAARHSVGRHGSAAGGRSAPQRKLHAEVETRTWQRAVRSQDPYDAWDTNLPVCAFYDKPLTQGPAAEVEPYGVSMVQANSPLLPNSTADAGVIVCVVDSGIWAGHPDLSKGGNRLDGCKKLDDFDPGGCPFAWFDDADGHGTDVNGILASPRNGVGVVGAIPGGAEVYNVRIWDTNPAVAYGEGPYASDLVLAYTQCEGRLRSRQAMFPRKRYRMVVNLSLGAAGPLTVEGMWFEAAARRGDMMFVAAAGNNGTDDEQWNLYPASYPQVISVGSLGCDNETSGFSQRNAAVSLAAPGDAVLTTTARGGGSVRGWAGFAANESLVGGSDYHPRAVRDARLGTVANASIVQCSNTSCSAVPRGAVCLAAVDRTSGRTARSDPQACLRYMQCLDAGGAALLLHRPADLNFDDAYVDSFRLDCGANCSCWQALQRRLNATAANATAPMPAVALSARQGERMQLAARQGVKVIVSTYAYDYDYTSGTSSAAPYVSGGAARLWAAFPRCNASEVTLAMASTAQDFGPPGRDDAYGHGLLQLEAAFKRLQAQPCAQPAASPAPTLQTPSPANNSRIFMPSAPL